MDRDTARSIQRAGMFTALTAAGALVAIPIPFSPVPIVLNNLFVILCGLVLRPKWAFLAMVSYLACGALGLPVFAGGSGGLGHVFGPTGGFLFGFVASAPLVAAVRGTGESSWRMGIAAAAGVLATYAAGVPWLSWTAGVTLQRAIVLAMVPFLPGDVLKAGLAVLIARRLPRPAEQPREPAA